jgi:glycosyltransferase involved in cell wall biosynthesis
LAQRFIERAKLMCPEEVETVAIINQPSFGRVKAKNYGAKEANGEILVFLDCDCIIGSMFLNEVSRKAKNSYFIGGGTKFVKLTRYSLGIVFALIFIASYLLRYQITVGAFWIRK